MTWNSILPTIHRKRVLRVILGISLGCWLALIPISGNAQLHSGEPGHPPIPGKIPTPILKTISTIHPGATRAEFSKLFDYYQHGVANIPILKAGASSWVFHYAYRLAYVPSIDHSGITDAKGVLQMKQHPNQVHWAYMEKKSHTDGYVGILILVDVRWKFAKSDSPLLRDNPDDVIMRISKPYLIYECGISG